MRTALLAFVLLCFPVLVGAKPLNVSVHATRAILINPENGAVLYQKGANDAHYPASILKLATVLYVLEGLKVDLDQKIVASESALKVIRAHLKQSDFLAHPPYLLEHDGVMIGLEIGGVYTVSTLIHGMLLASGNDAANVLAEGVAGSIEAFMEGMNQFFKEKGINNSQFQNPSGLHHPAQITTAADMARIAALCFECPTFQQIIQAPALNLSNAPSIRNTNPMLTKTRYYYPPLIGGKTGYISRAGYNYVAAAESKGRRLIAVILGCETSEDRYKDAMTLFEAAFRQKREERTLFSRESTVFYKEISKAEQQLTAVIEEDLILLSYPAEDMDLSAEVRWKVRRLPIDEGEEVGTLVVMGSGGQVIASSPLVAAHSVCKRGGETWPFVLFAAALLIFGLYLFKKCGKRL